MIRFWVFHFNDWVHWNSPRSPFRCSERSSWKEGLYMHILLKQMRAGTIVNFIIENGFIDRKTSNLERRKLVDEAHECDIRWNVFGMTSHYFLIARLTSNFCYLIWCRVKPCIVTTHETTWITRPIMAWLRWASHFIEVMYMKLLSSTYPQINAYPNQEYLNLIGTASAESLLSSTNEAYMQIHNERNGLKQERDEYQYALSNWATAYWQDQVNDYRTQRKS